MSPLKSDTWVHEICRIWCPKRKQNEPISTSTLPSSTLTTAPPSVRHYPTEVCCLCGIADCSSHPKQQGLVKCAATGCSVMFHPMCATLATKLNNQGADGDPKDSKQTISTPPAERFIDHFAIRKDIEICQEYTLDLLEVTHEKVKENRNRGVYIKRPIRTDINSNSNEMETEKESDTSIVPVGFCGLHNPERNKSFYGCTPGAELMSEFIYIPFHK